MVSASGFEIESPALLTTRSTPPNVVRRLTYGRRHRRLVAHVDLDGRGHVGATRAPRPRSAAPAAVAVGEDHRGPLGGQAGGDGAADAGRGTGDEGDPTGERLGRG